jgi:glycosyltransferase involved in cell wall biosynthesis
MSEERTTEQPLVSVVIPVFNGELTIQRAIDSVFTQTHPNVECIVVDDKSKDSTAEILRSYGDRIQAVFNEKNRGTAGAYNIGTSKAKGEFVILMASDCCMTDPDHITKALVHMSDEKLAAVSGQGIFDHLDKLDTIQRIFTTVNLLDVTDSEEEVFEVSFIETRCDLVRYKALEEIGFWFEGLYNSTEDQDISARIRQLGYRLIQDKRIRFALDFGQTEDNLYKVVKKQYKYANGQGYIFLKYGLGHHTMTGAQANRRSRIWHRFIQILLGPATIGLALLSPTWPIASAALALMLGLRATYYFVSSGRWLSGIDRIFCAFIGLLCDLTYSLSFLGSLILWIARDPSVVRFGRPVADQGRGA